MLTFVTAVNKQHRHENHLPSKVMFVFVVLILMLNITPSTSNIDEYGDIVIPFLSHESNDLFKTYWDSTDSDEEIMRKVAEEHCPRFQLTQEQCQFHYDEISKHIRLLRNDTFLGELGMEYTDVVQAAVDNDSLFATFKSHPVYMNVVENHLEDACARDKQDLMQQNPSFFQYPHPTLDTILLSERVAANDLFGNPPVRCEVLLRTKVHQKEQTALLGQREVSVDVINDVINVDVGGIHDTIPSVTSVTPLSLSSSTLRYLKVAHDLDQWFSLFNSNNNNNNDRRDSSSDSSSDSSAFSSSSGVNTEPTSLSGFKIAEIGVGYGGQAQALFAIMCSGLNSRARTTAVVETTGSPGTAGIHYYFYDLPPVLALARKYTSQFPWIPAADLHFMFQNIQDTPEVFDLCISYCAVSELSRELQLHYITTVLSRCRDTAGVVVFNRLEYVPRLRGLSPSEFINALDLVFDHQVPIYALENPLPPYNVLVLWGNQTAHAATIS